MHKCLAIYNQHKIIKEKKTFLKFIIPIQENQASIKNHIHNKKEKKTPNVSHCL